MKETTTDSQEDQTTQQLQETGTGQAPQEVKDKTYPLVQIDRLLGRKQKQEGHVRYEELKNMKIELNY